MDMKRIYRIPALAAALCMLPLTSCFDDDINRSMYEADADEMQRENHIVGASLKGMQGLVIPTREHLYQFMDAMAGGSYGGYMEGIVDTWVMKFSTFNPEQGWLKSHLPTPSRTCTRSTATCSPRPTTPWRSLSARYSVCALCTA